MLEDNHRAFAPYNICPDHGGGIMSYAVEAARSILSRHWDGVLPVNLHEIAKKLNVKVEYDAFSKSLFSSEPEISGTLTFENNVPTCTINLHHHENRQRFTLAHELGHFALQHGAKTDNKNTLYRNGTTNPDEVEANAFAAELLMPKAIVRNLIVHQGVADISELAKIFLVSEQAMKIRLKNLGWINE